ncbi:uncharacterized protein LOC129131348 isoform X2 [Agelaius phoeniceus]|uniref:uncharacterized protein LOC129131348 isoform X2 n=1 Tax=Agelaius phoeniceus TaxID=39638 RepID=UPI004055279A
MASFFTATLKSFQGGKDESPKGAPKDDKAAALPSSMAREEFEEYQRQLLEEKVAQDRDTEAAGVTRGTPRCQSPGMVPAQHPWSPGMGVSTGLDSGPTSLGLGTVGSQQLSTREMRGCRRSESLQWVPSSTTSESGC